MPNAPTETDPLAPIAKPTIPDVVGRFHAYYVNNPVWGSLHTVLDDGNVEDQCVQWCVGFAQEDGDTEGEALAHILLTMSRTQRSKLPRAVYELDRLVRPRPSHVYR